MLRDYLQRHWKDNEKQFLFPNRKGTLPRWRDNVVKYGLKPVLRKLETPERNARLHTFRRGLATELAETEPITVLQTQMRHADVRTTLRVYAHVIPDSQQESMERITNRSIGKIASESAKARINTGEHAPTVQIYQLAWEMGCKVPHNKSVGGSVWESNPPFDPRRTESPALKAGEITGPLSPPRAV